MEFKVNHLHIKTSDPRRTAEWFVENLGATITRNARDGQRETFRLDLHGLSLNVTDFLSGQKLEQHYGMEHLALDTNDIAGTVRKLKDRGIRVLEERQLPDGRQVCFFEGPEGVRLEFMEWK